MHILQTNLFLERLLRFLIPFFTDVSADLAVARAEALETLVSYGARTRAELLCSAQIIVFSFAALETLAEANNPEISPSMRLRFRGCANNLNRSSQKTEQALARRLACDAPVSTDTKADPINDLPDPEVEEMLQQTQARIAAYRDRADASRPVPNATAPTLPAQIPPPGPLTRQQPDLLPHKQPSLIAPTPVTPTPVAQTPVAQTLVAQNHSVLLTQKEQNKRLWGAAMMDTLAQMGMPVKPAAPVKGNARPAD